MGLSTGEECPDDGFSERLLTDATPTGMVVGDPTVVITTPSGHTPNVITVNGEDYGKLSVMTTHDLPQTDEGKAFQSLVEAMARAKLGVGEGPDGSIRVTDGAREVKAYLVTDKMELFGSHRKFALPANDHAIPSILLDKERFDTRPLVEKFDD